MIDWFLARTKWAQFFIITTAFLFLLSSVTIPILSYSITKRNNLLRKYEGAIATLQVEKKEAQMIAQLKQKELELHQEQVKLDSNERRIEEIQKDSKRIASELGVIRQQAKDNLNRISKAQLDDLIKITRRILKEDLL